MNKEQLLQWAARFKETRFSRFFRSVRVAIGIILIVVIASILGTIFLQNAQPEEYVRRYGQTGFYWIRLLGLHDVYHSWWYIVLLAVLTLATITCISSRLTMKIVRSGSLFVHINIITILVGIVIGRFGESGFLQVNEGEKSDEFWVKAGYETNPKTGQVEEMMKVRKLQFAVALHDFYIQYHDQAQEKLVVLDSNRKVVKQFPIEKGKLLKMPKQKMGLTVLEKLPDAHVVEKVVDDPQAPFQPAVELALQSPQGEGEGWLLARSDDYLLSPDQKMMVQFRWFDGEEEMCQAIKDFENSTLPYTKLPHVFQIVSGKNLERRILHFEKGKLAKNDMWVDGKPISFPSAQTTFYLKQFIEHAQIKMEVHSGSGESRNPAIRLAVGTMQGIQGRWLFANQLDPHSGDSPFQFYYSHDFPIKAYVSDIKILDGGKEVMRKSLRVNHPLKYKGVTLFQASYDKENERWSGIQVTRDPGIPVVYTGFVGMMIGLILMFYVNPILNKFKEPENEEIVV